MPSYFPATGVDELTQEILESTGHKVYPRDTRSKFLPYSENPNDPNAEIISPFTDFIYYHKLPQVYRDFDSKENKALYRYLRSLIDGGYANLVYNATTGKQGIENLFELIDPQTCPSEFLPIYCESFGIEWFQDLVVSPSTGVDPYYYIRTFLSNVGEIYKRRGTESVIKYIAKVLTSKDIKLNYRRTINESGETVSRIMWVEPQVDSPEEVGLSAEVIQRFISTQIPYYLTSKVLYVVDKADIEIEGYMGIAVSKVKKQTIVMPAIYKATANDFLYRITDDEVYIIKYIGVEGRLEVPRLIEDKPVVEILSGAFAYNSIIEYVKLPDTLRAID